MPGHYSCTIYQRRQQSAANYCTGPIMAWRPTAAISCPPVSMRTAIFLRQQLLYARTAVLEPTWEHALQKSLPVLSLPPLLANLLLQPSSMLLGHSVAKCNKGSVFQCFSNVLPFVVSSGVTRMPFLFPVCVRSVCLSCSVCAPPALLAWKRVLVA